MLLTEYIIIILLFMNRRVCGKIRERKKQLECKSPYSSSSWKACYCDNRCQFYNDCCNKYDKRPRLPHLYSCKTPEELNIQISRLGNEAIMVVDKCPPTSNENLRRFCEKKTLQDGLVYAFPVIDSHRLFKNVFCARCYTKRYYKPITEVSCYRNISKTGKPSRSEIVTLVERRKCHLFLTLPPNSFRPCTANRYLRPPCKTRVKSRNALLCRTAPTRYSRCKEQRFAVFRNIFCARCSIRGHTCTPLDLAGIGSGRSMSLWGAYRYDFLFDFFGFERNSKLSVTKRQQRVQTTPTTEINSNVSILNGTYAFNGSDKNDNYSISETGNVSASKLFPNDQSHIIEALSIAGGCLSLLSLLFLIVTYSVLPSLRSFGSQIVLALAITMATALSCFLLGPVLKTFVSCHIIAVVTHLAYLSSFVWMSLLAIDLYSNFSSSLGAIHRNRKRHFIRYVILGWGLPAFITTAAILVDHFAPKLVICPRFGKGGGVRCYLHSKVGLFVWIYIPVSICVCINMGLSICLFKILWRTSSQTREVQNPQRKREMAFLCLKITSIVGLTWSISLLAAWTSNKLVTGISGIINSLQGFLLAIAFLGSPRVIRAMSSGLSDFTSSRD